jgi:hypothetical protein
VRSKTSGATTENDESPCLGRRRGRRPGGKKLRSKVPAKRPRQPSQIPRRSAKKGGYPGSRPLRKTCLRPSSKADTGRLPRKKAILRNLPRSTRRHARATTSPRKPAVVRRYSPLSWRPARTPAPRPRAIYRLRRDPPRRAPLPRLPITATPERSFTSAHKETIRLRRFAYQLRQADRAERFRIEDDRRRAAANITEQRRQEREQSREQLRMMRADATMRPTVLRRRGATARKP